MATVRSVSGLALQHFAVGLISWGTMVAKDPPDVAVEVDSESALVACVC